MLDGHLVDVRLHYRLGRRYATTVSDLGRYVWMLMTKTRFCRLYLVCSILLILLAGCQIDSESQTQVVKETADVLPTLEATVLLTATVEIAVEVRPQPTPTATVTQVHTLTEMPSPTATSTPFLCPYLRGQTISDSLWSTAMVEQVSFLVHLPPCYEDFTDRAFPVIYLFHGWPLNEWHWINLGMREWGDDWISRGLSGPFIMVLPGLDPDGRYVHSSGGDHSFEGFVVNELVSYVDQTYRTVQQPWGRAVGGISRGGVWALEIAMRHQDIFGSVGGHSPALALNRPLPQYDPYLLAREDVSALRFYLDAGDADWARAGTLRLRDLLLEYGADVTYEDHSGGHVDALWSGAIADYLAFYTAPWPLSYEALPVWGSPANGAGE